MIAKVEIQKMIGKSNVVQFAWFRLTMYALVKPANIITILAMPTQSVNLCGCILFLCSINTVLITSALNGRFCVKNFNSAFKHDVNLV